MHQGDASEDCLYLNVWTTAGTTAEKHPVMVYFYGGGFSEGSNAIAVYDGEELARKGVALVSVNYRVGAMGFFSHPELSAESEHEASGNYGLLDKVAALEWIKNNIVVFGGDPNNVTIFGQSAGAISVELLMQSPLASGLFHRAIPQSGPGLIPPGMLSGGVRLLEAEAAGMVLADSLGAESLSALRTIAAERFLLPGLGRFGPITDGWFLPENNEHNASVPVMIGFTANDIGAGTFGPPPENSVIGWEHEAQRLYGEFAGEFLTLYPADSDDVVAEVRQTSSRDRSRVSLSLWAAEQAKKSSAIYTYYFDRAIPWPEHPEFGAFHTGEIPYVFNNLAKLDRPWEGIDSTVADQVSSYWVNFATAGDPSGPDLGEWPPFSAETHVTMELGETMGPMPLADPAKVDFWLSFLTQ